MSELKHAIIRTTMRVAPIGIFVIINEEFLMSGLLPVSEVKFLLITA